MMITNSHNVYPYISWCEPLLDNQLIFINFLKKLLNMLEGKDQLMMMKITFN